MRTSKGLFLAIGLALTLSAPAGAVVSIGLVQVGGTYSASVGIQPGDTLVLSITYSLQPGDTVTLIDPAIVFDGSVQSFNAGASTETGLAAWSGGAVALNPITTGDIGLVPSNPTMADGWEKATAVPGGASSPCTFGACTSLGTASFVLTGNGGVIAIGGVGLPGGTVVRDGTSVDIAGNPALVTLGSFTFMPVPEPATAGLLGLGLLGLTAIGRRRRR